MDNPAQSETSPLHAAPAPALSGRGATLFVWATWAVMLVGVLVYIRLFAVNVPYFDEFSMVGLVTGDEPVTLRHLWAQHNEHRIPLPRLVYLGLARLTHSDFRAGMYASGLIVGFLAAGMIVAARRLRGRTAYADAFFPLALLHFGHVDNLLASFQVAFTVAALLTCCLLWLVLRSRQPLTSWAALAGGVSLLLLPLCGAHGLPFVPPLAAWLLFWAWRDRRASGGLGRLLVVLAMTTASLFLVVFYFRHLTKVPYHPDSPSWQASLQIALQFFTMGAGPGVIPLWPYSAYVVGALLVGGPLVLAWRHWRHPMERVRCLGLGLFLVGMAGLAGGIGYGRAGLGAQLGFSVRYVTLSVPALCGLYFLSEIVGTAWFARSVQWGLFACLALLLWPNSQSGIEYGRLRQSLLAPVVKDLDRGFTADQLAQRHPVLFPIPGDFLAQRLEMLRRAGIGKFKRLSAPPAALREIGVPAIPALATDLTWQGVIGRITGTNPCLGFVLPQPQRVYGIRLTYGFADKPEPTANFILLWKHEGHNEYSEASRGIHLPLDATPGPHQVVLYVNDTLNHFIVRPDVRPCTFGLWGIQLLVPDDRGSPPADRRKTPATAPVAKADITTQ